MAIGGVVWILFHYSWEALIVSQPDTLSTRRSIYDLIERDNGKPKHSTT